MQYFFYNDLIIRCCTAIINEHGVINECGVINKHADVIDVVIFYLTFKNEPGKLSSANVIFFA